MGETGTTLGVARGAPVFVHQAFTCCPYAALVTARIHDFLIHNGHPVCDHPEEASASVINTCGFNASRAEQALRAIHTVHHRAAGRPLVVAGCLTRIERERVREALSADGGRFELVGPGEHDRFDELFAPAERPFAGVRTHQYNERYSARDPRLGLYQVPVATGCLNECTYCVIRHAKGSVVSRPLSYVVADVERGLAGGHRDVFLVADDLSCYGLDLGADVVALVQALTGLGARYSAEAFEPSRFLSHLDALLPLLARGDFDWIVLPAQSGSDSVLERMGRRYTADQVRSAVARIGEAAPRTLLSTDLIFGYPGETDDDFAASLDLARSFGYANFNEYEARPGTPASTLDDDTARSRRGAVQAFLREQGGQLEVLTRNRATACATWSGEEPVGGEPPPSRWAVAHRARVAPVLEHLDPTAGWQVTGVDPHRRSVRIRLSGPGGAGMCLALEQTAAGEPGLAASADYTLSLLSEGPVRGLEPGPASAVDAVVAALGLRPAGQQSGREP